MSVFARAVEILGADLVETLREQSRRDMRDHPPTDAQLDEMARLLLILEASADRNTARQRADRSAPTDEVGDRG